MRSVIAATLTLLGCAGTPRPTALTVAAAPLQTPTTTPREETPAAPLPLHVQAWESHVRAMEIDPSRPDAWYNLARLYEDDGALHSLQCARTLDENFVTRARGNPRLRAHVEHASRWWRGFPGIVALQAVSGAGGAPPSATIAALAQDDGRRRPPRAPLPACAEVLRRAAHTHASW